MERRKSSMDTNKGQKCILRHPTTIGIQRKSSHTVRHIRKSTPKIKLNANNKSSDFLSISSPRLKNFPAEEMRKVRKSQRPNVFPFPAIRSVLSSPTRRTPLPTKNNSNCGQGDTVPESILSSPIFHNFNLNQTISQPFLSNPTSNKTQYSNVIPNYNSIQQSPDRQTHRPFVPNTVRNLNPKFQTNSDNHMIETPNCNNQSIDTKTPDECDIQSQNDQYPSKFLETISCEKQPVGGRNAEIHRVIHLSKEKQLKNHPISQSNATPEQKYQHQQQIQPLTYYYDYHHEQKPYNGRGTIGMTSPQDLIVNSRAKNLKKHSLISQQQNVLEYPPRRSINNNKKKVQKNLQYTPAMIHDQELLVLKMRQQGINEETMKRQFNTLLNEQQRQLLYQQQLVKVEEKPEKFNNMEIQTRRKINKIEDDEKPDWMKHITPSWIPYVLMEETKNNLKKEEKKSVRINDNYHQQSPQSIKNNEKQFNNINYHTNLSNLKQYPAEQFSNVNSRIILKTPNDNNSIIKHKQQNNGLQDWESVKEVMATLENVQNQKGFEYFINSNKKKQKVQLNGVQDPNDPLMQNLPYQLKLDHELHETSKKPSANGLENKRNSNNPLPPSKWHLKNCNKPVSEYPRRQLNNRNNTKNCFVMPAEKEDGTWQNVVVPDNVVHKNSILDQNSHQIKEEIAHHNYGISYDLVRSNSLPSNIYSQYQPVRFNNFHVVSDNIHYNHMPSVRPNEVVQQYVQPNIQMQRNLHRPEEFVEARIIGGIKYFAMKSEYTPHTYVNETSISHNIPNQSNAFH